MTRARIASREGEGVPLRILIPPPRHAWGGWPSRSDGRVGAVNDIERVITKVVLESPHPDARFTRVDPPHKGEG
jgi:hypothetical protein